MNVCDAARFCDIVLKAPRTPSQFSVQQMFEIRTFTVAVCGVSLWASGGYSRWVSASLLGATRPRMWHSVGGQKCSP
jgi:hypothetical protein